MLDIKWIRQNQEKFDHDMQARNAPFKAEALIEIDEEKRKKQTKIEELQSKRNNFAKEIANLKRLNQDSSAFQADAIKINSEIENLQKDNFLEEKLNKILLEIPNILSDETPIGKSEVDNKIIEISGEIRKFDFAIKSHFEIGENLKMLDFEQTSLISGSRFSTLSSGLARLERALSNFMLDFAIENGYTEISPPNIVKSQAMFGSGQLPKFAEEAFCTKDDYWLIPTAEVPLVNLVAKKILKEEELPFRFVAYTPCFRREAGSAGKDTRGMIREHQFKKVELVSITDENSSEKEHERMTGLACEVLKKLELPFRKILLSSGDIGFSSSKTYDLEVWLPSQNQYREISSCSNCLDFQARRLGSKYKSSDGKNYFTHTLNGSALAIGRTIVAILENYQLKNGDVELPSALRKYFSGQEIIKKA